MLIDVNVGACIVLLFGVTIKWWFLVFGFCLICVYGLLVLILCFLGCDLWLFCFVVFVFGLCFVWFVWF